MAYTVTTTDDNIIVEMTEQGPTGPAGAQGATGATGPQGADGTGSVDANTLAVTPYGTFTASTLQSALEQLADTVFQQANTPTANLQEGDMWYDTTNDILKVYKNTVWEPVSLTQDLDTITMNGGYF